MAASSQHPGLWAEQMQLVLPSHDGKPETIRQGPLRECAPHIADALRRASKEFQRFAVLLTDASKVGVLVALLRKMATSGQQPLVGSISEHQWLVSALDVIVATPEQALQLQGQGWMPSCALEALVIDLGAGHDILDRALNFAACFSGFESQRRHLQLPPPFRWYSAPKLVPPSPGILQIMSGCRETWDYFAYASTLGAFSWGSNKIAVQSWWDVPVFLPGIVRGSLAYENSRPLVLAPREKLEVMAKLILATAAELGLPDLRIGKRDGLDDVLLLCPDELLVSHYQHLERLLVVEADKLLDTSSAWKIQRLARICLHCPVGLHFSRQTDAVKGLLQGGSGERFCVLSKPGVTMENVFQFCHPAGSYEEKLARLLDVADQLVKKLGALHVVVFCNSDSSVLRLAQEMTSRGFSAWSLCAGDDDDEKADVDPDMYEDHFSLLVTNVYRRTSYGDVINFELPETVEEYVERVGRDRSTGVRRKMVINLVTAEEHRRLAQEFVPHLPLMVELPDDCSRLHSRIPLFFPGCQRL